MLNYIFNTYFDRKTKVLIFTSMLIFLPLFFLVYSPNFADKDVFLKQSEKTTQIFNVYIQILKIFLIITTGLLTINHDEQHIKQLIPFVKRKAVYTAKLVFYFTLIFLYSLFFISLSFIFFQLSKYPVLTYSQFKTLLVTPLDSLYLLIFILIYVKNKKRQVIFIIQAFFIIFTIISSFLKGNFTYFLLMLPLSGNCFDTEIVYFFYKIFYLFLLILLYIFKQSSEKISFH